MLIQSSVKQFVFNKTFLTVSMALVVQQSFAATDRPIDSGATLQTFQNRQEPQKQGFEVQNEVPIRSALGRVDGVSVAVSGFKISGNTLFSEQDLQVYLLEYQGKTLDFNGLQDAVDAVSSFYRSNGYFLTQSYLPEQTIENGVVEIAVIEAKVGAVELKFSDSARLKPERAHALLGAAIQPNMPVSEKNMERGLLLLNDTPGVMVHSILKPSKEVGKADLLVELSDDGRKYTGNIELDNWGSRYTGRYRLGGTLNVNNVTGYGDLLSVKASISHDSGVPDGVKLGRLSYTLPVGGNGLKLGASYTSLAYGLGKEFDDLGVEGEASIFGVSALYPFIRSRNLNIIGSLTADHKYTSDSNSETHVNNKKNVSLVGASVVADYSGIFFGNSLNTMTLTLNAGNVDITDKRSLKIDQSESGYSTNGHFYKLNGTADRQQVLPNSLSLLLSASGQWASKDLPSSEQFYLGGPDGVRAYPIGEGLGDDGFIGKAELRWNKPNSPYMFNAFVDGGIARLHKEPLVVDVINKVSNTRAIMGYGVGVNIAEKNNYLVRTSLAWRSSRADSAPRSDSKSSSPNLWVQFSKWF